ncbi:ribbon-helix-helix domain-containing protein [Shewanella chilikensis]|uniref:ribbon-helix-helix domain-containing protein n=1 Tax=Shewanella chilikensis TaxID=558541 RepID=UPI003D162013
MCEIYSGADPALFELKTRSVRLGGVVTSIRLEAIFLAVAGGYRYRGGVESR